MFISLMVAALVGCSAHSGSVESMPEVFVPPSTTVLTGSPCVDGLLSNIEARCDEVLVFESDIILGGINIVCNDPLPVELNDLLYGAYTQNLFVAIENTNSQVLVPESFAFLCQDLGIGIGFLTLDNL